MQIGFLDYQKLRFGVFLYPKSKFDTMVEEEYY